jgi:hypothetical protein
MLIHLHKQATTTPKVRAAIQASDEPASALAERYGTTEQTIYKWRHRDSVHDRTQNRRWSLSSNAVSIRLAPLFVGVETSTILRFQNVTVLLRAKLTGSPSAPALNG